MSDLYVHLSVNPTAEQQDNLALLGRHLILNEKVIASSGLFAFGNSTLTEASSGPNDPRNAGLALPPVGFGPAAGVAAHPGEDWRTYMLRAFAMMLGDEFEIWIQGVYWTITDPSVRGAALRIAYTLDYGVPGDWPEILFGNKKSDYATSGFIWERLDLIPGRDDDG